MTNQWETVRIFISSTFEDMHAERDYLVKQVFPELREWCELRKLNLVDIDLRWGVKEDDTQNKNVVEVCLKRIDDARPFFLCFLGQRRGWIPQAKDISSATLATAAFPDLSTRIGNNSVTEMEILHALVHPFHGSRPHKDQKQEYYEPVKHAFFYLREPSYLDEIPEDFPDIRKIYTNDGLSDQEEQKLANKQLEKWRMEEIPALCQQRELPLHHYKARWNRNASSPELRLPLTCSSLIPANQKNWQNRWSGVGVITDSTSIDDPIQIQNAEAYNQHRTRGRLTDFEVEGHALKQIILNDLKIAIADRFPEHTEIGETSDLQKELDQQEQFLQVCREGFISRGDDFKELNAYIQDDRKQAFLLTAPGGLGKSTLLANWIEELRKTNKESARTSTHFRFIGQSDRSTNVNTLLYFLLREIKEITGKLDASLPDSPTKLREELPKLLATIGKKGKTIFIFDGLNQLETSLADLSWIPWQLPENIKLIVSFKRGEANAEELLDRLKGQVCHAEVEPFTSLEDRRALVKVYLSQYLKDLDEHHIETLIQSEGASNPLFLKVALSELRVFGAFGNLGEKIKHDFGETPLSAFNGVLRRLEEDPAYSALDPHQAVPLLFGLLAQARAGLSANELSHLLIQSLGLDKNEINFINTKDAVFLFLRQVRPFLAHRDGRYDFFYESFKLAAVRRYKNLFSLIDWHFKLADYFGQLPTWKDQQHQVPTVRKVAELPYHLAMSGQSMAYQNCLTDFDFLLAKVLGAGPLALLEDFKFRSLSTLGPDSQTSDDLTLIERCISLSLQNIQSDPGLFAGQLIGRLGNFDSPTLKQLLDKASRWTNLAWIRPLTTHFKTAESELQASFKVSSHNTVAVRPTLDGAALIVLSQETAKPQLSLKRIDSSSGKVIHQIALESNITHAEMKISRDGKKTVVVTKGLLFVYETESLTLLKTYPINNGQFGGNSLFLRISPDSLSAFVIEQKMVTQIHLQTGEHIRQFGIKKNMLDFIFSPSGKLAAFCLGSERWVEPNGVFTKEDYYSRNNNDELYVLDIQNTASPKLISSRALSDMFIFSSDEEHLICVNESGRVETWLISRGTSLSVLQALNDQQFEGLVNVIRIGSRGMGSNDHIGTSKIAAGAKGESAICSFGSAYMATLNTRDPDKVSIVKRLYSPGEIMKLEHAHGNYAVSMTRTNELIIWNIESGKLAVRLTENSPMRDFSIARLGDKTVIFSINSDSILRVWDISHPAESAQNQIAPNIAENSRIRELTSHPREESILVIKPISFQFYSVASKNAIREIRAAQPLLLKAHFHPDGERIVLVFLDGSIQILSLQSYQPIKTIKAKNLQGSLTASALSPDGKWLLYGESDSGMQMINLESERVFAFEETAPLDPVHQPTPFARAAHWQRYRIVVFPESMQLISYLITGQAYNTYGTQHVAVDDREECLEIHDLKTGKFLKRVSHPGLQPVTKKAEISKNGRSLYQLISRKDSNAWTPSFSYFLEKSGADLVAKQVLHSRTIPVLDFSVSPDESYAALVTEDGWLEFVSLDTGDVIAHFIGDSIFTSCITLADGRTICTGDEHGIVNFFRVENVLPAVDTSQELVSLGSLAIANNSQSAVLEKPTLAEGSPAESKVPTFTFPHTMPKEHTLSGHRAPVMAVAITPDGCLAVSGSFDKTVKVWEQSNAVEKLTLLGHQAAIFGVALTPDGKLAISGSADQTLKVWDLQTGSEKLTFTGHTARVNTVAVTPDGRLAVSGGHDETLRVWDVETGKEIVALIGHSAEIQCATITADGRLALSGSGDKTLKVWDLQTGQEKVSFNLPNENSWVHTVAITPDGRLAVTGSGDHLVRVWDLESKRELLTLSGHTAAVHAVAITVDGRLAVSGAQDKTIKVWDLGTGMEIITLSGHGNEVTGVAITPDGRRAISCSFNGTIKLWDWDM